jgi:hypothetical protein
MNSPKQRTLCFSFSIFVFLILFFTDRADAQQKVTDATAQHVGTWKLVSTKYGDAKDFTKYGETSSRLKLINPTHFTWIEVDATTKKVLSSAGGSYKLSGNTYTETIDFAGDGMDAFLGKSQKFTIKIEGDKLFQSGELSNGLKIEENWERVR